jgi:hypothetical protein
MVYSKDILRKLGSAKAPGIRDVLTTLETLRLRLSGDQTAHALVLLAAAQLAQMGIKASKVSAKQASELSAALSLIEGHESLGTPGLKIPTKGKSSKSTKILVLSPRDDS